VSELMCCVLAGFVVRVNLSLCLLVNVDVYIIIAFIIPRVPY